MNITTLKSDLPASLVVFLVALPLCLGIALASGAPLISGIISGIIGGFLVGLLSKSQTSVSGPAAGLAAVVLSSIHQLGTFEAFLLAVIIAGIVQIVLGVLKWGFIADYFPSNVIKGLLAAIGIVLILKQIPHAIGYDADYEGDFQFIGNTGSNTFADVLSAFDMITPAALLISVISIIILVVWDKTPLKKLSFLPSSLFVVLFGIIANQICSVLFPEYCIQQTHLVTIPAIDFANVNTVLRFPDFTQIGNSTLWIVAFTIAIVASLETLLNIEAVDKLDPHKRHSPPNRELIAQGIGNISAGLLGGIPVTSVIVRSSVNIQSGNATNASAIFHGILILLSVLFFTPWLNLIPLASLASILLVTGYKLAKVSLFKDMYNKGIEQFVPFVITILAIVFTDLLIGVLVGLGISIVFLMISNFKNPYVRDNYRLHLGELIRIILPNQVSFLNKASIKESLWDMPSNTKVIIDASSSDYIDNDILEIIEDFKTTIAPERGIQLNIIGQKDHYQLHDYVEFINVLEKDVRDKLTPEAVLDLLKIGNQRFVQGKKSDKDFLQQVTATAEQQNPMCVIVGCIDSRATPEILFDTGLGDVLTIRIAGNIINPEIIGSLEIACSKLGAKLIVVKAHSHCGAVTLSMNGIEEHSIGTITKVIKDVAVQSQLYPFKIGDNKDEVIEKVAIENALHSVNEIIRLSPYLAEKIAKKEIGIVSAYHDITTGIVTFGNLL